MPISKKYVKTKEQFNCTFRVPKKAAQGAKKINLVGEFNEWKTDSLEMQPLKNGDFKIEIQLNPGKAYQYRYLIDDKQWQNDIQADAYWPIPEFSVENSVINVM
ncbi:isoamylase early set domain-containing protein [Marinicellulosiphila megalodicopiae]|uniref:isoamylase early set domain-containing protein n=1 Tax=Marinicellulosiphila megalodicopiae TaxID=2724896 RepID=UPI003BB1B752